VNGNSKIKPIIAITMGDPAGVGGEVTLKALAALSKNTISRYVVVGDFDYLNQLTKLFKIKASLTSIQSVEEARDLRDQVGVLDLGGAENVKMGEVSASCGVAAVDYIYEASKLALQGKVKAIVTAPINKESIHKGGCVFPGHTELLAHLSKTKSFAMMMVGGPFKIVLQSIHVSIKDSLKSVTPALVSERLNITHQSLRQWFGISNPRIAVAGVNPHAGENGAFGNEEIKILKPVIAKYQRKGWQVSGPHPADTLYYWAAQGKYDAVLCMNHDQGLIPFKLLAFDDGVNMTLGLPYVRTSPDHGTAFDIAGKGVARPQSMIAAMKLAEKLISSQ
jgi:4-hydroxythreonine-4-phosphate dehydrogenase